MSAEKHLENLFNKLVATSTWLPENKYYFSVENTYTVLHNVRLEICWRF